jgi:hypothetical protein
VAWTYTEDPAGSPRDAVRFALGDTDPDDQLCSDALVAYALTDQGDQPKLAAALLAERLAARFAREEAVSVDGISLGGTGRASAFRTLAATLRAEVARTTPPAEAVAGAVARTSALVLTGVRLSDMAIVSADADIPPPQFTRSDPRDDLELGGRVMKVPLL